MAIPNFADIAKASNDVSFILSLPNGEEEDVGR